MILRILVKLVKIVKYLTVLVQFYSGQRVEVVEVQVVHGLLSLLFKVVQVEVVVPNLIMEQIIIFQLAKCQYLLIF